MAIFHCNIKIVSRGAGRSAVGAVAYRAGEKITNEYDGIVHDYTRKQGVVHTEIMLPDNAPSEYSNRAILWNAVEKIEKAKNSQLAREITLALPIELSHTQNINLVREYVKSNFTNKGMCADIAVHDKDGSNPHAHIILTMRPFDLDENNNKIWGAKSRKEYMLDENGERIRLTSGEYKSRKVNTTDWNDKTKAEEWREEWANVLNKHLEYFGHPDRIDHRSFERQGITDQLPTIHLGVAAHQMEQRGIRTERGDINRAMEISNHRLRQLNSEISILHKQIFEIQSCLDEETQNTEPPTLAETISDILEQRGQIIVNPQTTTDILHFLRTKHIEDYAGLERYLKNLMGQQREIAHRLSPIKGRLAELAENIRASEVYTKHKTTHKKYQQDLATQHPWKKKSFEQEHGWIVQAYEASKEHIDTLRNNKKQIPINTWKKEQASLTAEVKKLTNKHRSLKGEVVKVDKMRIRVYDFLRKERQNEMEKPTRSNGRGHTLGR